MSVSKRSNMPILILLFFYLYVSLTFYEYKCGKFKIFTKLNFYSVGLLP